MFQPPFTLVLVANSRGGKSTFIRKMIMDTEFDMIPAKFHPENVYIISPTIYDDKSHGTLIAYMKKFSAFNEDQ